MTANSEQTGWPPENLRLLLKACIAGDGARQSLEEWLEHRNIDDVSWAELRLLATLAGRIREIAPDSKEIPRLEGIRRFVWAKNQVRLDRCIQVIDMLQRTAIPIMLLKGMARIATNPSLAAARFVRDIDLMVHSSNLLNACEILINNGWRPVNGILPGKSRAEPFSRAWPLPDYKNPDNDDFHVDIHRSVIHYGRSGTFDDDFWKRCRAGEIRGRKINVPGETDQFLQAILHATISDPDRPVDWVIDAMDASRSLDWELLEHEIDRRRAGAAVAGTLGYLEQELGLQVPDEIKRLVTRDKRNPVFNLEVKVYWRLPANRIRYGGVYRNLAEWMRSRHCRYKLPGYRNTFWTGRRIGKHEGPISSMKPITTSVMDCELAVSGNNPDKCIIDIEVPAENGVFIQFDMLLDGIWHGRLAIPQSGENKPAKGGIWRFEIPFAGEANPGKPQLESRLLLLDEQFRVSTAIPDGLKIAISPGEEISVPVNFRKYETMYGEAGN